MENLDYRKIGIVFSKGKDKKYNYKSVDTFDKDSDILNDSVVFDLDSSKCESLNSGKSTNFTTMDFEEKKYITLMLDETTYRSLCEYYKKEGCSNEECHSKIVELLKGIGKKISTSEIIQREDIFSFSIDFKNKKQLEANGTATKSDDNSEKKEEFKVIDMSLINPKEVADKIKQKVIAQDKAVDTIVNNIYNNQRIVENGNEDLYQDIAHIFMDGPTGTGKTLIIKEVAKELSLPMIIRSATMYSATGYKGLEISEMLVGLLDAAGGNLEAAERGIIVIDEFDKLAAPQDSKNELEMHSAVQQELLPYLDGGGKIPIEYKGKVYEFDTSKVTFVCAGAFQNVHKRKIAEELDDNGNYSITPQDYIDAGLMEELVGRFSVITATKILSKNDLARILKESSISPLKNLKQIGQEIYDVDITYDDKMVDVIAEDAYEEGTGARALQTTVNGIRDVVLGDLFKKSKADIMLNQEIFEKSKDVYVREGGVQK